MRTIKLLTLLIASLTAGSAWAGSLDVNTEDKAAGTIAIEEAVDYTALTKAELKSARNAEKAALKAEKQQLRSEKRMNKLMTFMNNKMSKKKELGGFSDPIDKWLWYAIIGAGVAIIFSIIGGGFLWVLATLFWIAAIAALVVWIIKKFG